MQKTWLIIKREYITRVRKRSFILFTLLGPLFFLLISVLPILIATANHSDQHILVKDESGLIQALPDTDGLFFNFKYSSEPLEQLKATYTQLDDGYDALLYIPSLRPDAPFGIEIYSSDQMSLTTRSYIENILADQFEEINLKNQHLEKEQILKLRPKVAIDDKVASGNIQKEGDAVLASVFGYVMGFVIYLVLLIYGTMVMRGVMEEKTSRIIEVMVSSVKPFQLMMGKIVGIGLVGLTQFMTWGFLITIINIVVGIVFGAQISHLTQMAASPDSGNGDLAVMAQAYASLSQHPLFYYLFIFILYFLGGYFMYAALFAAIGSLVGDDDTDVQMFTLPVTMLILISIFIMMSVVQQPHTKLAFWASMVPFSSPIVMPARIPFGVPGWQVAISVSLLIGGFIFTTFLASRIYRTAILLYGKKVKFREIVRWMRYNG